MDIRRLVRTGKPFGRNRGRLASETAFSLSPQSPWGLRDLPRAGSWCVGSGSDVWRDAGNRVEHPSIYSALAALHSNYMLNRGYAYTSTISSKHHGENLLSHLASLYPHSSRHVWQERLTNGEVTLDGIPATGSELVLSGQSLVWNRAPWVEAEVPRHFEVIFSDSHIMAVSKPSGLPTLPGGGYLENTLLRLVQKHVPGANPVHRLGRGTSGIVLFAKTPQAASNLTAAWNTPKVQKIYRALAQNVAEHDTYEILTPIGLVPHPRIGYVWAAHARGKPSKSVARVVSRTSCTTTFEVSLNSGRPHQIRIHLASIGHPLVGDPLYGVNGKPVDHLPGLPGDGGYLLHAQCLRFPHPITGEQISLEAPLPCSSPSLTPRSETPRSQQAAFPDVWGCGELHVVTEHLKQGLKPHTFWPD